MEQRAKLSNLSFDIKKSWVSKCRSNVPGLAGEISGWSPPVFLSKLMDLIKSIYMFSNEPKHISNQDVFSIVQVLFLCLLLKIDFLLCFWIPEAAQCPSQWWICSIPKIQIQFFLASFHAISASEFVIYFCICTSCTCIQIRLYWGPTNNIVQKYHPTINYRIILPRVVGGKCLFLVERNRRRNMRKEDGDEEKVKEEEEGVGGRW